MMVLMLPKLTSTVRHPFFIASHLGNIGIAEMLLDRQLGSTLYTLPYMA